MTMFSKLTVVCGVVLAFQLVTSTPVSAQEVRRDGPNTLPPGEGREIVAVACNQCHNSGVVMKLREGQKRWNEYVRDMILYGAQVQPQEIDVAVQYLLKNFGPTSPPVASSATKAIAALPAGAGRELVEARCVMCHDLERVTGLKRTNKDWQGIVANMVDRGAVATPEEVRTITAYLTAQFGSN